MLGDSMVTIGVQGVGNLQEEIEELKKEKSFNDGSCHGLVTETSSSRMWMEDVKAECTLHVFSTADPKVEIVAVVKGDLKDQEGVATRIHSECFTGDILGSLRCDCGQQLHRFLRIMNEKPCGVLLYVRGHEGRGIGLAAKISAYKLQDQGHDTVDANLKLGLPVDSRTYDDALGVLKYLQVKSICLFTNNPDKIKALQQITKDIVPLASVACERNKGYLETKRRRLNHRTVLDTFQLPQLSLDISTLSAGIVYTAWNQYYVKKLSTFAEDELLRRGVKASKMEVPGACELISGTRMILRQLKPDAVIVIGVLIRGQKDLYSERHDATANAVMNSLVALNSSQDVPIINGLLTYNDEEQANRWMIGSDNPAKAWVESALHMAALAKGDTTNQMKN